jgi:hypothetical protein
MSSDLTKVTGAETLAGDSGPLDALIGFYHAFNARDLRGLAANWMDGDTPSMDNPIGGIRRGWPAIREVMGSCSMDRPLFWSHSTISPARVVAIGISSSDAKRAFARHPHPASIFASARRADLSRRKGFGDSFITMDRWRNRRFSPPTNVPSSERCSTDQQDLDGYRHTSTGAKRRLGRLRGRNESDGIRLYVMARTNWP